MDDFKLRKWKQNENLQSLEEKVSTEQQKSSKLKDMCQQIKENVEVVIK